MADASPTAEEADDAGEARVVGLDSADADELIGALSSDTARTVLATLAEEPAPPSKLADRTGRSLQTVQYHLRNLQETGLVEVVETATSEKGREMDVYAPADVPVVVLAGDESTTEGLRGTLSRLLGGLGLLALASLLVQEVAGGGLGALFGPERTGVATDAVGAAGGGLPPGLVFFAGGAVVLLGWLAVRYLRPRIAGDPPRK